MISLGAPQGPAIFALLWQAFMPVLAFTAVEANRAHTSSFVRWCA